MMVDRLSTIYRLGKHYNGVTVLMEPRAIPNARGVAVDNEHGVDVQELQSRPGDQDLVEGVEGLICRQVPGKGLLHQLCE
jgi:hypothetical protein